MKSPLSALLAGVAVMLGALALAHERPPSDPPLTLTFGVYQTDKATVMYRKFTPLLEPLQDELTARLGQPVEVQLTIFKSYDDGIEAIVAGKVDFVHFGPAPYIIAKARNHDLQLVAMEHENGAKRFQGVIVVGKTSPIQGIDDLRGQRFAFGDPNSTIGRYLVQAELVKHGIRAEDLSTFDYLERHDQVASAVAQGDFDAGSVKYSTFQRSNGKGALRVIATFDNVTKPIVARGGLEPAMLEALRQSFFSLKPDAVRELKVSGFMETSDLEYQFVREGMKKAAEFAKPARG